MKLEFESNAVSSPLVSNQIPAEFDEPHSSPEVLEALRAGIKAAQDGDRAEARNLLLGVTESDPKNENAWLWLASISEYPEELLVFLNNVLQINPENERALEWAEATKSLIAKTFVQRGIDAAKDEQKQFAKQCFLQAIVHDAQSELAYLWLASVSESFEEKMSHLQRVLSINPENENALSSLRNAKESKAKGLLPKANTAAISGKREEANELLQEIFADAPDFEDAWMLKAHISESFDEKIAAFERVLEINPDNPVAKANIDSLKAFSVNSDEEPSVERFEDSHEMFAAKEPMESALDTSEEEAVAEPEAATEQYRADDKEAQDFQYHEEEEVSFEEVAAQEESEVFDVPVAKPEEDLSLEVSDDAPADEQSAGEEESADEVEESMEASENDADVEAKDLSEDKAEEVDHDYVSENVDFSADESSETEMLDTEEAGSDVQADNSPDEVHEASASEEAEELPANVENVPDENAPVIDVSSEEDEQAEMANPEASEEVADVDQAIHESGEPEMPSFETAESLSPELPNESKATSRACVYCNETNEAQAFACQSCKAIFTISDIEMIVSHKKADKEVISKALERMEADKSLHGVDTDDLKYLGIGYLNLKEYRKGFEFLQEAAKKDPSDVILVSQMDALAVRLAEIEDQEKETETKAEGKKILVVDDSPTVRKLISGKLEKCGHEPICAVDGMDALAKINEEVPDLILLDITMPRMDGYQVCKLIRSNEATKDVPVVMISGKDGFFDKVRGRMAGTSNYITKPFGPETLMKTVNEYIQ